MTIKCPCGGIFRRSDLKAEWSSVYRRTLTYDTDPIFANWKCNKCGALRKQRKRQPKVRKAIEGDL